MSAQERVAVVTGAASGLGTAIADRFVADGHRVLYAGLDGDGSRTAAGHADATGESALAVEVDIRELSSVESCLTAAVDRWDRVDVWVNNAALTFARPFFELDPDEWDDVLKTNLRGTYFGCRGSAHARTGQRQDRQPRLHRNGGMLMR